MKKIRPVIYQLLPRLFGNVNQTLKAGGSIHENGCGKFNDISETALQSVASMGVTHIWYTGILEHGTQTDYSAFGIANDSVDVIKGVAGSPYAVRDYYDVDPDLAVDVPDRMAEFEQLVQRTHKCGMKVIIDLIPNHVARHYLSDAAPEGTAPFGQDDDTSVSFLPGNNFYYLPGTSFRSPVEVADDSRWHEEPAKATGNDCFTPSPSVNDWYETVKLNYGVDYVGHGPSAFDPIPDTWLKMRDIVLFWSAKKVDGFRCDMAGMVPIEFWRWLIAEVKKSFPDLIFIGEVYDASAYTAFLDAGFSYLYDKVVFYDSVRSVVEGKVPASVMTQCWQRTEGVHNNLLYFLENHDEQRLASDFFAGEAVKGIPALVLAATMFSNPVLVYFGQELGETGMDSEGFSGRDGRTSIFDYWSLKSICDWRSKDLWDGSMLSPESLKLRAFYQKLLVLINREPALSDGQFYDVMWANGDNQNWDGTHLFAYLRYTGEQCVLVVVNLGPETLDYRLIIPHDAFVQSGLRVDWFYTGVDRLGLNAGIQFPGEIATEAGLGSRIEGWSAAVYELKGKAVK